MHIFSKFHLCKLYSIKCIVSQSQQLSSCNLQNLLPSNIPFPESLPNNGACFLRKCVSLLCRLCFWKECSELAFWLGLLNCFIDTLCVYYLIIFQFCSLNIISLSYVAVSCYEYMCWVETWDANYHYHSIPFPPLASIFLIMIYVW